MFVVPPLGGIPGFSREPKTELLKKRMKMRPPYKQKKKSPTEPAKINPPEENQKNTSKESDVMDKAPNP